MARSTYYYHSKKRDIPDKYTVEKSIIKQIYHINKGRYGYRRITLELRNQGYKLNHKTVLKLMKLCGIKCLIRAKRYRSYRGTVGKVAPNILERNFEADKPNEKWVTDVTEFSIKGSKVYLSPIMDLYNREIISYNISEKANFNQVSDMIMQAIEKLPEGMHPILHSDQGWQYQMKRYQNLLKSGGIKQSMSRKGNCLDNAVIENFFGILKSEMDYQKRKYDSIPDFKKELIEYIQYYNKKRIKSKLKGLSPVQFRIQSHKIA